MKRETKDKCNKLLSKKIKKNINEEKYVSNKQAIAVAYSQVKKKHKECAGVFIPKTPITPTLYKKTNTDSEYSDTYSEEEVETPPPPPPKIKKRKTSKKTSKKKSSRKKKLSVKKSYRKKSLKKKLSKKVSRKKKSKRKSKK